MCEFAFQRQVGDLILERKWDVLLETAEARTKVAPHELIARLTLIIGCLLQGNYPEAYKHHATLFSSDDGADDPGNDLDIREHLHSFAGLLVKDHPDNPGPRLFLGLTLAQIGDLEGAIREYKESARLDPGDSLPHYFHGQAHHAMGRIEMAIREYREAVKLAPHDVLMRLNLGSAYHNQGNLESAIAQYREAIKLNPNDHVLHYNLGLALCDQGRMAPAIAAYKESARLNPEDALVRYALGVAQETKGNLSQAIAEYEAAIQLNPGLAIAYTQLGWILYNLHRVPQAAEVFEKAVKCDAEDPQALHGLGLAKLGMGKEEEAIRLLAQAYQKEERPDKKRVIRAVLVKVGFMSP